VTVYEYLGVKNFSIKINSVGCEKCRPAYKEQLKTFLRAVYDKLSPESQTRLDQNPLRILDSKDEGDAALTTNAPLIKDHLCEECSQHFNMLQSTLSLLNIPFTVDGRIVRGLDYYTKTAFEIITGDLGSQDALAGGGRYDLLTEQLGGKSTPAVGFAAGIERLLMVMEKQGIQSSEDVRPQVYIAAADQQGKRWAIEKAFELRRAGISCDTDMLDRSLKAQMREADRQHAEAVIVVGEHELRQQQVTLKRMSSGGQTAIPTQDLVTELGRIFHPDEKRKAR